MRHLVEREHRDFARGQRRAMTRAEAAMWQAVRGGRLSGWKFKRQVPYGRYVADFSCAEARLIIELDGEPHQETAQQGRDAARDRWFAEQGFRILRIPNDLVLGSLPLAVRQIEQALAGPSPGSLCSPPSPWTGEGL